MLLHGNVAGIVDAATQERFPVVLPWALRSPERGMGQPAVPERAVARRPHVMEGVELVEEFHDGFLPRDDESREFVGRRSGSTDRKQNHEDYGSAAMGSRLNL